MSDCQCHVEITTADQRKTLIVLLGINAIMFVVEILAGIYAQSSGLIADGIDMLADALVYAVALYAVGRSATAKQDAAWLSGWFQILIGIAVAVDVIRRSLVGSEPISEFMIAIGTLALLANLACVLLIAKHRHEAIHMRASWIFSRNDLLANLGLITGGILVWQLGSAWPDLLIGGLISAVVIKGGWAILSEVKQERSVSETSP